MQLNQKAMVREAMKSALKLGPYCSFKHLFLATLEDGDYFAKARRFGYIYFVAPDCCPPPTNAPICHRCSASIQPSNTGVRKRPRRPRSVELWVTVMAPSLRQLDPVLEEAVVKELRTLGITTIHVAGTTNRIHVKFKYEKAADAWIARGKMVVNGKMLSVNACREEALVRKVERKIEEVERERADLI